MPTNLDDDDSHPNQPEPPARTHHCHLTMTSPNHIVYSDQTGRLPKASSSGNSYLFVAYNHDSNDIFLCPIKTREVDHLKEVMADIYTTLSRSGFPSQFHRLDNECSQLKDFFAKHIVQYQLAPPDNHCSIAAE